MPAKTREWPKLPPESLPVYRRSAYIANPGLMGDPEAEAVGAARSNESHAQAAAGCSELSKSYRRTWRKGTYMLDHRDIVRYLSAKKIPFVLTGTHGISGWTGRTRSTYDVDILVKGGRNFGRAVKALQAMFPNLEYREFAGVAGFFVPGEKISLLDVTYPHRPDIQETLATAMWVEDGDLRFRIPRLEAALANKYGASITPTRDVDKRTIDMVDFYQMVLHSMDPGRESIDLNWLRELGEKVWPGGGGAEILELVEQAKSGRIPAPKMPSSS